MRPHLKDGVSYSAAIFVIGNDATTSLRGLSALRLTAMDSGFSICAPVAGLRIVRAGFARASILAMPE